MLATGAAPGLAGAYKWCRDGDSGEAGAKDVVRFQYAILEVKLADEEACPPWVMVSHHLQRACFWDIQMEKIRFAHSKKQAVRMAGNWKHAPRRSFLLMCKALAWPVKPNNLLRNYPGHLGAVIL